VKGKLLTTVFTLLLLAGGSAAEQIEVRNVAELVKPADLIARVKIVSVRETGAKDGYAKIAWAQVVEAVKGAEAGQFFDLENESVSGGRPIGCPNVSYAAGEDVLVFARKLPNGNYHTLYADAGKIPIREGRVDRHPFKGGQSYDSAAAEVRREVKRLARVAAAKR
jgi:hypothetical protein